MSEKRTALLLISVSHNGNTTRGGWHRSTPSMTLAGYQLKSVAVRYRLGH